MKLFDLVQQFNTHRGNELLLYGFLFDNIQDEQKAVEVLKKYKDNNKPMTIDDLYILGIIDEKEVWDV